MSRYSKRQSRGENSGYWLTYSDMLSGLLLMFILLLLVFLWKFQTTNNRLISDQSQLRKVEADYNEMKTMVDRMVGVRTDLIKELKEQFEKNKIRVEVAETGAIKIESSIFFDFESTQLKPAGKAFLNQFFPVYLKVLSMKDYESQVKEIIVEGHTDTAGGYMYNLDLSQGRALSVVNYCLSGEIPGLTSKNIEDVKFKLSANGRSYSKPVYDVKGKLDPDKSRRVEFLFRLADEEVIKEIAEIMSGNK